MLCNTSRGGRVFAFVLRHGIKGKVKIAMQRRKGVSFFPKFCCFNLWMVLFTALSIKKVNLVIRA
jgi:hypothetical protein